MTLLQPTALEPLDEHGTVYGLNVTEAEVQDLAAGIVPNTVKAMARWLCEDLLCWHRGTWLPVEVKRPRGRLTPLQAALRKRAWFPVVESVSAALALFGLFYASETKARSSASLEAQK